MTAQSEKKLSELIEKYSFAPDFFEQNISSANSRTLYGDQLIHAACVPPCCFAHAPLTLLGEWRVLFREG